MKTFLICRFRVMLILFSALSSFFTSSNTALSQTWLNDNNSWQYELKTLQYTADGIYTMQIAGDTIIQGHDCKILSHSPYISGLEVFLPDQYAYEENEALFAYSTFANSFLRIYDFALEEGDSIEFPWGVNYVVAETGTMQIDFNDFRFQEINFFGGSDNHLVIEGIGLVGIENFGNPLACSYLSLAHDFCNLVSGNHTTHFRCFTDGDTFLNPHFLCTISAEHESKKQPIIIYPNPVSEHINIEIHNSISIEEIRMVDLTGKTIEIFKNENAQINIENSPSGIYFLKIKFTDGTAWIKKIIKN